jgi:intracellular sulfur oxidation DsrE/DsrF family protein
MKKIISALAAALAFVIATSAGAADNRVVIQVSDNDSGKWNLALNNARNLQTALGKDNVDIELVAYGPGIAMLKADSLVGNRIEDAGKDGVRVVACENTMKNQKLVKDDMLRGIAYAPAGVVQIMERQKQGWSYIRP